MFRNKSRGELVTDIVLTMEYEKAKNPGPGYAIFISGADPLLGGWQEAYRLQYNKETDLWTYGISASIVDKKYKFIVGQWSAGERVYVSSEAFKRWLKWEEGEDRILPDLPAYEPDARPTSPGRN